MVSGALFALLVLVPMMGCHSGSTPSYVVHASNGGLTGDDIDALDRINHAYERIAASVRPGVVSVQSTQMVRTQDNPMFNDPFFRRFFGQGGVPTERREHALGSGVLVGSDGTIVTNNHVIEHASDIQILLADHRTFKAKVIGADPQTDVAVVKIDAQGLPTVPLGDSSSLKVGDVVMAFGNPFGLSFTVTRGAPGSTSSATRTSSRPTPPSTRATPVDRWSTPEARSSGSTPPSSAPRARAARAASRGSASPSPPTWCVP
jgi:S1-C subfamily serine protease